MLSHTTIPSSFISAALAVLLTAIPALHAQDRLPVQLPVSPSGFSKASAIKNPGWQGIGDGLSFRALGSATYDSNASQGNDSSLLEEQSDLILSAGAEAFYVSEGESLLFGGNVSGVYDHYFELDDYSGANTDIGVFAAYNSGKLVMSVSSKFARDQGVNRYYGNFVEQLHFANSLTARYRLSPKTSFLGTVSHTIANAQTGNYNDTSSFNIGLSALWAAGGRLDVGPGIRYGVRSSDADKDVTTIGPSLNLNYQLATKVTLRSTLGLSFVEGGNGNISETTPHWALILNYKGSEIWAFDLSLYQDVQANPGFGGGLDEVSNLRLGYTRTLPRFTFKTGLSYESRAADSGLTNREFDYLTLDASIAIPFADAGNVIFSSTWRDLSSEDSLNSWNGIQTGVGLMWRF